MRIFGCFMAGLLASATISLAQQAKVPAKQVALINTAVSSASAVAPAAPRKLLVMYRCDGYKHSCIPVANKMFEMLGKQSGAFEATFTDDMAIFDSERLAEFDAILLNNTTRLKFGSDAQRAALIAFVRDGKGLIGIHSSSDNFYDFPEAAEMIGGMFDGHPWGSRGTWGVKVDDPDHPVNASFGRKNFEIKDEIYQIKGAYSRDTHRVLLSLDMDHRQTGEKGNRADKDYGITWLKPAGEGRVFYCSLGHNEEVFWNAKVVSHYLAGIQYAIGDLKVDDSPSTSNPLPKSE